MSMYRQQRNYGCRIHDQYTYHGLKTVVLENELVRISILAGRGTDIFEYLYKPKDLDFIWLSEHGVSNPNDYLPTSPDPVSTFIDYYPGGWQEVFPNGGPTSAYMGAQFGQHGEVALMPWDCEIVLDTPEKIAVRFQVKTKKVPFRLTKTMTLERNCPALQIEEVVENASDVPLRYMWGQHLAFGAPFLAPGCTIELPEGVRVLTEPAGPEGGRVARGQTYDWPVALDDGGRPLDLSVLPEYGTATDIAYMHGFGEQAWYRVANPNIGLGMEVSWDSAAMPYLWYWQEFGATKQYPWYGRHYNIGLEPFAGYPTSGLAEAINNGSAGSIGPRESRTFTMKTLPYTT